MNMNITFVYDGSSAYWIDDPEARTAFCKSASDYFMEKYEATKFLCLKEICDYFGARCPVEWCMITFANVAHRLLIEFKDHDTLVFIYVTVRKAG